VGESLRDMQDVGKNIHTTSVGTILMKVDTVLRESGEKKPNRAANAVLTR
jgi:hypothetical protein